jgi:hypothetical protein
MPKMTTDHQTSDRTPAVSFAWLEIVGIGTLLIALCYTCGWSYAYHYFERFNLGLLGLDIPREYFFLYAFWAINDQFWWTALLLGAGVGVLTGISILLRLLRRRFPIFGNRYPVRLGYAIVIVGTASLTFYGSYTLGERAAVSVYRYQADNGFPSYHFIQVWADPAEEGDLGRQMALHWQTGDYRLLMRNKDHLFLFYPEGADTRLATTVLPSGKIRAFRTFPLVQKPTSR